MENHAGNSDVTVCEREEEKDRLTPKVGRLASVTEQLELKNLRQCDPETLSHLLDQLQDISKEIRSIPIEVTRQHTSTKKALLKDLQEASIELLLALDQYSVAGRTSQFYRCLIVCHEHLEQAVGRRLESSEAQEIREQESIAKVPAGDLLTQIRIYYKEILRQQQAFDQLYEQLLDDELYFDHYSGLVNALDALRTPVQQLYSTLNGHLHISGDNSFHFYQLQVHLCYVDEQIQRLKELVQSFRTNQRLSEMGAGQTNQEVMRKLGLFQRRSSELPKAIIAFLDNVRFQVRGSHRLHLVEPAERYL